MLFAELVSVSREVAATSSRLAKRATLAELLRQVPLAEVEIATAYLSGTLTQRRTGIGWRGLSDLPAPAARATVSIGEVDVALDVLSRMAGQGSAAARRAGIDALFARLTDDEQAFLRALMTGQIRQGALDSVMLDAIAEAASLPATLVRRSAMFSAASGPIAHAALSGGAEALADFGLEVGRPIRPMLAGSAPDVAAGVEKLSPTGDFVVDTKLDGIRIQVHRDGDDVSVFTRSLDEISARLPEIVAVARSLPVSPLILDGEALLIADDGTPRSFQDTASRAASTEAAEASLHPFFFDLLLAEETPYLEEPLTSRLERLDEIVPAAHRAGRLVTSSASEATTYFDDVVTAQQEGVILKRLDAPYDAGRRGSAWIKVKPRHTLDLVVLAVEHGSGRRKEWLSNIHLGARNPEGGFTMLGKTFKGMTDEMLAWQTSRFRELEVSDDGWIVTVRPEQVVEIALDGIQRSTRYPGGMALRFARVLRYRDDKSAAEADTLETVRALGRD